MAMVLPGCDELFLRYLGPWYSEADWARRVYQATRPDIEQLGVDSELTASDISRLTEESQADVAERVCGMCEAATWDWAKLLKVRGTPSSQWIAEFDRHFQRRQIQEIIDRPVRGVKRVQIRCKSGVNQVTARSAAWAAG